MARLFHCTARGLINVRSKTADSTETDALATKAVEAPNWLHSSPNISDAGKTVIP